MDSMVVGNISPTQDMWTIYGDRYIAVNESGRLRSKQPMRLPNTPYPQAYQRPIDAGIQSGHIVFFVHGGLNDLTGVTDRIIRFSQEFGSSPFHLIHLAWDTGAISALDDILFWLIARIRAEGSWKSAGGILGSFAWNLLIHQKLPRSAVRDVGAVAWKANYNTALAATSPPGRLSTARDRGFHRPLPTLTAAYSLATALGFPSWSIAPVPLWPTICWSASQASSITLKPVWRITSSWPPPATLTISAGRWPPLGWPNRRS